MVFQEDQRLREKSGYDTMEEPDVNNKQSPNGIVVYIRKKTRKK